MWPTGLGGVPLFLVGVCSRSPGTGRLDGVEIAVKLCRLAFLQEARCAKQMIECHPEGMSVEDHHDGPGTLSSSQGRFA